MASQTKKFLYHCCVSLIDGHVQGWLTPFVSSIHVTSGFDQLFHDYSLVPEGSMMDCTVTVFVLNKESETHSIFFGQQMKLNNRVKNNSLGIGSDWREESGAFFDLFNGCLQDKSDF